jgi:cation transport ATPase
MRRIDSDYRVIIILNSMLILLGVFGVITPAVSATLHNLSTIGISVYNMTDLIEA